MPANVSTILIALVLLAVGVSPAWAQDQPCASEEACTQEATLLADRAAERFREGDLDAAAVLLREAIELHATPALHHNLARTLAAQEHWAEAREHYRAFLTLDPETSARDRIEAEIARLDALLAEQAAADHTATPDADPPIEPAPNPHAPAPSVDPAPWVLFGIGVAVVGAAIPCAVLFQDTVDQIRASPSHMEAVLLEGQAETFAIAADVLFAAGAAIALAGLIWGIVSLSSGSTSASALLRQRGPSPTGRF